MKKVFTLLLILSSSLVYSQGKVNIFADISPSINKFDKPISLSGASLNVDFKTFRNLYIGCAIHNWAYEFKPYWNSKVEIQSNTSTLIDIRGIFRANRNMISFPFFQLGVPIQSRYEPGIYVYNAGFGIAYKNIKEVGVQANFKVSGVNYEESNKIMFFVSIGLVF